MPPALWIIRHMLSCAQFALPTLLCNRHGSEFDRRAQVLQQCALWILEELKSSGCDLGAVDGAGNDIAKALCKAPLARLDHFKLALDNSPLALAPNFWGARCEDVLKEGPNLKGFNEASRQLSQTVSKKDMC